MEAPIYPPAAAFEPPIEGPFVPQLENVSLAELMNIPAAKDILLKHLPSFKAPLESAMLKPHLSNLTVQTLADFIKPLAPEVAAAINVELGRLPPVQESEP